MTWLTWVKVLIAVALIGVATSGLAGAQVSEEGPWVTLSPAEIQRVQEAYLSGASQENPCPSCKAIGQWDSNWENWMNPWAEGWGYAAIKDGKVNERAMGQMGYVANGIGGWVILEDTDPYHSAEWLTLSKDEILQIQNGKLSGAGLPECPSCQATGQWDPAWEKYLNDWSIGWIYRTISAGRLNTLSLGQMGFVGQDGKWMIIDGSPNPGEGGGLVTLVSLDTLKLQQAMQSQKPDRFASLKATGAWDQSWADALWAWGQDKEWAPVVGADPDKDWKGVLLINERRVAPMLMSKLGFSINDTRQLVP
jgi:hypothetical protein